MFGRERVTSGAASDIEQAIPLARLMVTRSPVSTELGTVAYGENQEEVFLGYSVSAHADISEETSRKIEPNPPPGRGRLREAKPSSTRSVRISRRSRGACSNSRRSRATRSRTCSSASGRCASCHRADHAALLRRAVGRQGPSAASRRAARSAARAAGLSPNPFRHARPCAGHSRLIPDGRGEAG